MADIPPLPRILRLGSAGRDVRALQRALQAAGVRPEPPNPKPTTFDEPTDDQVRLFQKRHHLFVDGEVGEDGITEQRRPPEFPRFADCSSFAIWCYWAAGAPDPNGTSYHGGCSGSLLQEGKEVRIGEAAMGDIDRLATASA